MNSAASALLNGAICSVPLTAAVWLALRVAPRRTLNAATRYVIWWAALAASLALPALFFETRQVPAPHPAGTGILRVAVLDLETQTAASPEGFRLPLRVPAWPWLRGLPMVWLLASAVLLMRLLLSHLAVLRACARAGDAPPAWRVRIEGWRAAAGSRGGSVRIAAAAEAAVPFAAGPFRPAIVIPERLFGELADQDLDRIGLHEAAHLARRDDYAILAGRVLIAAVPWHPAARWIARQIDVEREIACDDRVVEATGSPHHYAECLTRVVELCGGVRGSLAGAGMAGYGAHLSRRVEVLVATPRHSRPRLVPVPVLLFAAGLAALAAVSARAPRLVAFAAPTAPAPALARIPIPQQEKTVTPQAAKKLARKLVMAAAATAAVAAPTASAQNTATPAQAQVQTASGGRLIAFLIDTAGLSPSDLQRASNATTKFVQVQMSPEDKVALLISTDRGVNVRQDFTNDREILSKAAQAIGNAPGSYISEIPGTPDRWAASLGTTVKMLGQLTGKKLVVYFSGGVQTLAPGQVEALVIAAMGANVAFYQVDVRSLIDK